MMTVQIKPIDIDSLSAYKQAYINMTTAPLDGMWLNGFVPAAKHFGFYHHDALIGYCCINDDGFLLQLYVDPNGEVTPSLVLAQLLSGDEQVGEIKGAFVSTAEPQYLSACVDSFANHSVNALMYQHHQQASQAEIEAITMIQAAAEQLDTYVDFAHRNIGAPREWLQFYFGGLIERGELFGYWQNQNLVATGECRGSAAYQPEVVDLGMIVDKQARGQGIATRVLQYLGGLAKQQGKLAICSTEASNLGAQTAIHRAGLRSGHRILMFTR